MKTMPCERCFWGMTLDFDSEDVGWCICEVFLNACCVQAPPDPFQVEVSCDNSSS